MQTNKLTSRKEEKKIRGIYIRHVDDMVRYVRSSFVCVIIFG